MTRILHIIPSADPAGGGPIEGVLQRGRHLRQLGHIVDAVTLDTSEAPWLQNRGIPIHAAGPGRGGYGYSRSLSAWLQANHTRYDHFVVNGIWQHHALAARKSLQAAGREYVLFTHGMLDPWFNQQYPLKRLKKMPYWWGAEYWNLRCARKVLFTSEEEMTRAAMSFWPYRVNGQVVNYGTAEPPQDKAACRERFYTQHPDLRGRTILLYLSRIHEKKGIDLLLPAMKEALARQPELHLVIAGGGTEAYVASLRQQAHALGLEPHVTWAGMLRGGDKWAAMHAASAFILPSHQENFGIAVAEALACGVPVLISDKINTWREIVGDGAGIVATDTLDGTRELLQRWQSLSASSKQTMEAAARSCYISRYTVDSMARSLLEALEMP